MFLKSILAVQKSYIWISSWDKVASTLEAVVQLLEQIITWLVWSSYPPDKDWSHGLEKKREYKPLKNMIDHRLLYTFTNIEGVFVTL